MSLASLKKKANAVHFTPVSKNGFNLYGTLRKHVYTQPNRFESRRGTPYTRNNGPQSHGGTSNSENVVDNIECMCHPTPKPPTSSVKNTFAAHKSRFRFANRPYPNGTFKVSGQGSMIENYNQSSYITSKKASCNTEDMRYSATVVQTQKQKYALCPILDAQKTSKNSGPCSS